MFATKVARGIFSTVARCSGSQITSAPLVVCSTQSRTKCTLPDLPYDYNALEPYISADIMQLHHSKHHQTYVNNYNLAEEQLAEAVEKGETSKIIR